MKLFCVAGLACAVCLAKPHTAAAQGPVTVQTTPATDSSVPAANPARPTVTNPATLPPVGYLQFEQGYLGSLDSPVTASQYGVNQVTKLAVHPRLMLLFGSQPFEASTVPGQPGTSRDAGSLQAGAQLVIFTPHVTAPSKQPNGLTTPASGKTPVPTVAVNYEHTVYAGTAPDIDMGSFTNSLILLLSGDIGEFHYDTNYIVNEQDGDQIHSIRRAQVAQTLSVNHPTINPDLQLSVELYHFTQPLVEATASGRPIARANLVDLLVAPSYAVRPNLVLDGGFSRGLTSTSTQWQSFAGFTYLLPHRLWAAHKR